MIEKLIFKIQEYKNNFKMGYILLEEFKNGELYFKKEINRHYKFYQNN